MWVFGYGSLIWSKWETQFDCTRRVLADLPDHCRIFNKASVKNWGTKDMPCPTLNLTRVAGGICRGVAFEFSDNQKQKLLGYLEKREGKAPSEMSVQLDDQGQVLALVSFYEGKNVIIGKTLEETASMVASASGTKGYCLAYVKEIAEELSNLGIYDPVVAEFWSRVNHDA